MKTKDVNMLSGSIAKGLLTISLPVMVMNVLQSLFNVVDMTVLKTYDAQGTAVGAVGVCGVLISLITGLVVGIASGSNVAIARRIGMNDREGVDRAIHSSIAFSIVAGLALSIIGISLAEVFLSWTNCPEELLSEAAKYFRLYFAGVPILMVYNFCAAIMRSSGNSKGPMIYLSVGGAVKVVFSVLFIAVFDMGVEGVAYATILSWTTSAVMGLYSLTHSNSTVKLSLRKIHFYKRELGDILRTGVPAGLQQSLYSIANVLISATVNSYGPAATTGISIANIYDGILYQISVATALAVMPYVSQNVGCGNIKRATQSVWEGILITVALGASFGALSAIFAVPLSSIMTNDPLAIVYSQQKMVLVSSTYFICGINEIFGAALRGMGKPLMPTVSTLLFMCALRFLWVWFVFPLVPNNLTFLYLVWPIGWTLSIVLLLFVYVPTVKKLHRSSHSQELT